MSAPRASNLLIPRTKCKPQQEWKKDIIEDYTYVSYGRKHALDETNTYSVNFVYTPWSYLFFVNLPLLHHY